MKSQLIEPGDEAWVRVLANAEHDFYHLPCYQTLASVLDELPRAFLVSDGPYSFLVPYQRRPIPAALTGVEKYHDVGSSYGYAGPISTRGAPRSFIASAARRFMAHLAEENVVSAFIRLHTLLNEPTDFAGIGEIVNHGPSVYIDLTLSEDELWKQTRRGHKRDLRVLQERGYTISMNNWDRLDDFLVCYYDTMRRLDASPFYFFPRAYFEKLRCCLGEGRIHLCLVELDGAVACAGLVTEINGLSQYHLSATADAHLQDHPSKLMLHYLRSWLKERGNRIYHVGGGVGALRDTLHLFKAGFSPLAADFYTWHIVPDQQIYDKLVDRRFEKQSKGSPPQSTFFPLYRAALG